MGCFLGDKLIIPVALRDRILKIAHEAHLGITKTKQLLRTKVWWPGLDRQVEEMANGCDVCQLVGGRQPVKEPLIPTGIPRNPWENIHVDLYGSLPDGNYVFGIINETSEGFKSFLKEIGSQQRLVTPYWPHANGEIEQFFRNVGKVIRGCVLQGRDYREGLQTF